MRVGRGQANAAVLAFGALRAADGALLVLAPRWTAGTLYRCPLEQRAALVARVLGGRELLQAAVSLLRPTRAVLVLGSGVDLAHAASMLALGASDRRWRAPSLASAAEAGTLFVLGSLIAGLMSCSTSARG